MSAGREAVARMQGDRFKGTRVGFKAGLCLFYPLAEYDRLCKVYYAWYAVVLPVVCHLIIARHVVTCDTCCGMAWFGLV